MALYAHLTDDTGTPLPEGFFVHPPYKVEPKLHLAIALLNSLGYDIVFTSQGVNLVIYHRKNQED